MFSIDTFIAVLLSYLCGSLSSAIIVCKIMGLPDPRMQGSKNPGATNVLRYGGKKAAIITLLGDALKGVAPVLLAKWYGFDAISLSFITFAAFIGHLYPIFFRFEGGKGVATAFGCWLALAWPVALMMLATWLITAIITRYSSLAALITAILSPAYAWYFTNEYFTYFAIIMSAFLIFRHRKNIQKLISGKEDKIFQKRV